MVEWPGEAAMGCFNVPANTPLCLPMSASTWCHDVALNAIMMHRWPHASSSLRDAHGPCTTGTALHLLDSGTGFEPRLRMCEVPEVALPRAALQGCR